MKLKTIEVNGSVYAEVQDGMPVYVHDDGKEVAHDAARTVATITRLNAEAKGHREAKEQAQAQLKAFEDIDPDAARRAFDTLRNIDDKKLIDAGQVEKVKQQAQEAYEQKLRAYEEQYRPVVAERDSYKRQLHDERLSTAFGRSKFIADRLAVPVDIVQARFGSSFEVGDDGRIAAKGPDGNPVYSRAKPGEVADFDEALEIMVDSYPYRDHILKGTGASGGGANGSRTGADGKRTVTRAAFDAMDPAEQSSVASAAAKGAAVIVD